MPARRPSNRQLSDHTTSNGPRHASALHDRRAVQPALLEAPERYLNSQRLLKTAIIALAVFATHHSLCFSGLIACLVCRILQLCRTDFFSPVYLRQLLTREVLWLERSKLPRWSDTQRWARMSWKGELLLDDEVYPKQLNNATGLWRGEIMLDRGNSSDLENSFDDGGTGSVCATCGYTRDLCTHGPGKSSSPVPTHGVRGSSPARTAKRSQKWMSLDLPGGLGSSPTSSGTLGSPKAVRKLQGVARAICRRSPVRSPSPRFGMSAHKSTPDLSPRTRRRSPEGLGDKKMEPDNETAETTRQRAMTASVEGEQEQPVAARRQRLNST